MILSFNHNAFNYSIDTSKPMDISLGVKRDGSGANCFYTDRPVYTPFAAGSFVGNVAKGGNCNVDMVTFTPHGNGTHTECIGHIDASGRTIGETLTDSILVVRVISVKPSILGEDQVMALSTLLEAGFIPGEEALIVRTLPNDGLKRQRDYSGSNPAYFTAEALAHINRCGVKHLLCDIPSVDREDDGGKLLAHKAFFGEGTEIRLDATITELIYVPTEIKDGLYVLNIQIAPFQSDASPSRPLLFAMTARNAN